MRGELASVTSAQINQYGVARAEPEPEPAETSSLKNLYRDVSPGYCTTTPYYGVASTTLFTSESVTSGQLTS